MLVASNTRWGKRRKAGHTWTSTKSASRTWSLLNDPWFGEGEWIGVKDIGGEGGGKGWSIGAPQELCAFGWGWIALGIDEDTSGADCPDKEEDGVKKEEGVRRLVTWLLPFTKSIVISNRIWGDVETERGRVGIWRDGAGAGTTGTRDDTEMGPSCPELTTFVDFCPILVAACIHRRNNALECYAAWIPFLFLLLFSSILDNLWIKKC